MEHVVLEGPQCPLCEAPRTSLFLRQSTRVPWHLYSPTAPKGEGLRFFRCGSCDLLFKDPAIRTTPEQARRHYEKHNNDLGDQGYRAHLLRLLTPVASHLSAGAVGLDYGCGPTLSLEPLARELGFECHSFDPEFFPDTQLLRDAHYDFVLCSEVVEHFDEPRVEFERLRRLIKPAGGILGLMTQHPPESFPDWWYQRDPTHVVFYSPRTIHKIAQLFRLHLLLNQHGVALLRTSA